MNEAGWGVNRVSYKEWIEEQKEEKRQQRLRFPVKTIKNIDMNHIRKVGYAVGIGSVGNKRDMIESLISLQNKPQHRGNPIICVDYNGVYYLNSTVNLMQYIMK